jgi:hypothetical protein
MLDLILLIPDERLKKNDFLLRSWVIDPLGDFQGLFEISVFVMTLGQIEFVLSDFWVKLGELFVDSGGVQEVLAHIVAVGEEGH